jgi:hypothetical protein
MMQVYVFFDFCSTNIKTPNVPWDKNLKDLNQENEQAIFLVHLVLSIVTETRCSRITNCKKKILWSSIVHGTLMTPSPHIHMSSIENSDKQTQSTVVEESRVPQICLLHCLRGNPKKNFFRRQEAVSRKPCFRRPILIQYLFLVFWYRFTFPWFGLRFFFHSLYVYLQPMPFNGHS